MIAWVATLVVRGTVADREAGEALLGDLIEEHAHLATTRGTLAAERWLAWQLLRSFPHFHLVGRRHPTTLREAGSAAARFYGGLLIVGTFGSASSIEIVRAWDAWPAAPVTAVALLLLFGLGYLGARLLPRAPLFVALAIGAIAAATAGGALVAAAVPPDALRIVALPCLLLAALCGGFVRVAAHSHPL